MTSRAGCDLLKHVEKLFMLLGQSGGLSCQLDMKGASSQRGEQSNISIMYFNARSVIPKIDEL